VTNTDSSLSPIRKVLENLAHSGVIVDDKADVVVRSSGKNVKASSGPMSQARSCC